METTYAMNGRMLSICVMLVVLSVLSLYESLWIPSKTLYFSDLIGHQSHSFVLEAEKRGFGGGSSGPSQSKTPPPPLPAPPIEDLILKQIDTWACIKNCGACCKLGPLSARPDLDSYLTPDELTTYKSMIGPDDWCKHFDQQNRMCTIYETRPKFCRVEKKIFEDMFKIEEEDFVDFCGFCCTENIADVYGEESPEMIRFEDTFQSLNEGTETSDDSYTEIDPSTLKGENDEDDDDVNDR